MIAVVGSFNLDVVIAVPRHPVPGETVSGGEIVEGAGHLPNLERPERFNEVLRRFPEQARTRSRAL